ncbi:M23 family metallopeptidase [Candidatus Parcubacteria bacterium]|nr:M23 family metallopeptidase [Candidatus Parcubacteria bacterium]
MKVILLIGLPLVFLAAYFGSHKPDIKSGPESTPLAQIGPSREVQKEVGISILPSEILQGDPAEILITGTTTVKSLTFNGKTVPTFINDGSPTALVGIDLKMPNGSYPVKVTLADGKVITKNLIVGKRVIAEAPLGIPESLGGNTPEGEKTLLNALAADNAVLANIPTVLEKLWQGKFAYPVENPEVTDVYGYTRLTVNTSISHKGTDFHAPPGTPVLAMNSGVVRINRFFTAYGNTIVIDHGFGISTMYMHLSKSDVKVADTVKKGQVIGLSGETGYAEGPHLHLTVKVNNISIDPMKFLELF